MACRRLGEVDKVEITYWNATSTSGDGDSLLVADIIIIPTVPVRSGHPQSIRDLRNGSMSLALPRPLSLASYFVASSIGYSMVTGILTAAPYLNVFGTPRLRSTAWSRSSPSACPRTPVCSPRCLATAATASTMTVKAGYVIFLSSVATSQVYLPLLWAIPLMNRGMRT